mmetsp:Transcript_21408/g.57590  ORF Transcript_21408/g.57590 Transcript_21408/m.57590 type:complete len:197 (+) Transcript_21408:144-734(+)
MAIVARTLDLVEPLQDFVKSGRPVFGTCAGLIFLSEHVTGQKKGGQSLLGGLKAVVHRNFFGRQVDSAERPVNLTDEVVAGPHRQVDDEPFRHVFIRAPAIMSVEEGVSVLATLTANAREEEIAREHGSSNPSRIIVGVQQGNVLATAFHPELTDDLTWHGHFMDMVVESKAGRQGGAPKQAAKSSPARGAKRARK